MYQSVDDDMKDAPDRRPHTRNVVWLIVALAAGLGLIWAITSQNTIIPDVGTEVVTEAQSHQLAAYRIAITEPSNALRRARLTDFTREYPESPRLPSVYALLDVLNEAEAKRWVTLTDDLFDPRTTKEDKIFALEEYEREWGSSLLGGRDEEIAEIRAELEGTSEKFPSRKLKDNKSSIPDDIDDDVMVGGFEPPPPPPPEPEEPKVEVLLVKAPEIIRAPTPNYPRKARRRGIEAVVTLSLNIDRKGEVEETELISIETKRYHKDFIKAAERAARRTRFSPKMVGDRAEPAFGIVKRYRFEMDN